MTDPTATTPLRDLLDRLALASREMERAVSDAEWAEADDRYSDLAHEIAEMLRETHGLSAPHMRHLRMVL